MDGILLINKPEGLTSHDVVDFVRQRFHTKKVGHSGTLDPLATGILVILIGRATKLFSKFVNFDKEYEGVITLGAFTTTADVEGKIIQEFSFDSVTKEDIISVFSELKNQTQQLPPMFSALRYKGKRLYQLARRGIEIPRDVRKIKIYSLEVLDYKAPDIYFQLKCSKGTYVRSIAQDIGKKLNCGAYISKIKRTVLGPFSLKDTVELKEINESHIRSWQ